MENYNKEEITQRVVGQLKHIFDPEIPVNIYDLGLIYKIDLQEKDKILICNVDMTLTSPGCPVADSLVNDVSYAVKVIEEIEEVHVNLTFDPPWDKSKVTDDGKDIMLANGFLI
ncbi:metal-sulfur cluster assembly factor [Arcobacter sp. F2176]|uniref:metal-sulfur cluster assembly factor n=1 Tax=Arcobacter sp. F2176 TaxID=2044511 RepID=UPI00100A3CB5|nr:iron-sulfur cluster assembly protein [Arcobacter sp. F2176]RXJ81836.1 FeS assembly SUF system protein [Arcobacter sp. F2176]